VTNAHVHQLESGIALMYAAGRKLLSCRRVLPADSGEHAAIAATGSREPAFRQTFIQPLRRITKYRAVQMIASTPTKTGHPYSHLVSGMPPKSLKFAA
jgi:hypothetical protein